MRLIDADEMSVNEIKAYISAQAKINDDATKDINKIVHFKIQMLIEDTPAVDAVKVVRCRYCKHFTEGMAIGMCKRNPDKPIIPVPYNHFCSYGEMRSENV